MLNVLQCWVQNQNLEVEMNGSDGFGGSSGSGESDEGGEAGEGGRGYET